jgi:hypothetical protein
VTPCSLRDKILTRHYDFLAPYSAHRTLILSNKYRLSLHDGFAYRISAAYLSDRLHVRGIAAASDKRYLSNKIRAVQKIEGVAFYLDYILPNYTVAYSIIP